MICISILSDVNILSEFQTLDPQTIRGHPFTGACLDFMSRRHIRDVNRLAMEVIPAMRELFQMDRQNYHPEGKVYGRPSARAIILKDGKVLLNYVAKFDCYEFPGGGIEAGETPECALQREVAEETGRIVVPETVREFGIVIRRQQDSHDPDGIFEQKNYYYFCDVTDECVPRKPDGHEILEGAEPVWVETLAMPIHRNRKAFEQFGEPFIQREMRVMDMADKELRQQSWKRTEEAAIRSLGSADYRGMLSFVEHTLEEKRTEGENGIGMHKMEFGYTRYEHTKRVLGWAKRLYDATPDKTGLRYEDLMIATIFHDVGRGVSAQSGEDHAKAGVPITRDWLVSKGYDSARAEYIAGLVGSHSEKWRMHDPDIDRNLLMLMEADLLDDMGLLGIVMDTLIVRARKEDATFYDCYNHYECYTHPMQHDCPVVTPEARALWDIKTESTDRFMEEYRKDILLGGENYIGYR
jgi:8-oxo-dGTP pyrophosphatase MutT (NUDIX family)